ncbi:hypothetical protein F2P81_014325 [Scophthalmus maximus]|uniref:Uncharacterized protein n=1 Tax=Scophthalmus maximus TaxID=52904 RepID=A0A6A4SNI7_SCOMX|nr:hypothetical protein F2P81_014325 [Scophthalmus maximus]
MDGPIYGNFGKEAIGDKKYGATPLQLPSNTKPMPLLEEASADDPAKLATGPIAAIFQIPQEEMAADVTVRYFWHGAKQNKETFGKIRSHRWGTPGRYLGFNKYSYLISDVHLLTCCTMTTFSIGVFYFPPPSSSFLLRPVQSFDVSDHRVCVRNSLRSFPLPDILLRLSTV